VGHPYHGRLDTKPLPASERMSDRGVLLPLTLWRHFLLHVFAVNPVGHIKPAHCSPPKPQTLNPRP
jgi:hypothetical protein